MKQRSVLFLVLMVLLLATRVSGQDSTTTPEPTSEATVEASDVTLTVAAAADLTPAFEELGTLFTEETGIAVVFNFGSTGQLTQQIEQGAPVDVFAAANRSYIDDLEEAGLVITDTVALYAQGRITIWTRADSELTFESLDDLTQEGVNRIAIANPEHAPYGVAAREALESAGLWETLQPNLILGENIAQTLQYAETGNVDVAIVALSLSIAAGDEGRYVLIPAELHNPLNQALAVVSSTEHEAEARQFAEFVNSEAGREVMTRYGFVLPEAEPAPLTGVTLTVAAASDLTPAFEELGAVFTEETGIAVVFNFGSTGQLTQQIEQGAPIDVFAAANRSYIDDLEEAGLVITDTVALYAQGRITIWTRADSELTFESLDDLTQEGVNRIAIANPEHAPYGVAAREALESAGLWETLQPNLILGENIAQTLQYAETGNVDVAIVALSLSIAAGDEGRYVLIPAELHNPLNQALAVVSSTEHEVEARQFAEFVNSEAGREVMRRYGFVLPGEETVE